MACLRSCPNQAGVQIEKRIVDDKYQYSMDNKDGGVHGWISSDPIVGFWIIFPTNEFRNGGPTKQNLTVHTGPAALAKFLLQQWLYVDECSVIDAIALDVTRFKASSCSSVTCSFEVFELALLVLQTLRFEDLSVLEVEILRLLVRCLKSFLKAWE
ncbi:hypothetical protein MRB53_005866 [Persea americana]|uniref:Uncharacterized protein n=1 Tax=Persea americana TaxID=3435 RepID=A0ACC2MF23_PERAE|nr:hypothetical protein MRB53_005866 [Persea americana]